MTENPQFSLDSGPYSDPQGDLGPGGVPNVDILLVDVGELNDGRSYVSTQFAAPWPPDSDLWSWFCNVYARDSGSNRLFDYTLQWFDGQLETITNEEVPEGVEERNWGDGSLTIVYPPGALFAPSGEIEVECGVVETDGGTFASDTSGLLPYTIGP